MQFGFQKGDCCKKSLHIVQLGAPGVASCVPNEEYEKKYKTSLEEFEDNKTELDDLAGAILTSEFESCDGKYACN